MPETSNLPAIRYELFVTAFEKKVTAAQIEIDRMRAMEQPYNLIKEAMERDPAPNFAAVAMGAE